MRDTDAANGCASAAPSGELISGRYRILGELGRGGMGAVYRAHDETTGHVVALKTLENADARTTRLFEREYHTLASLTHPRMIEVHDFGISANGQRFYTMELLPGSDLLDLAPVPYVDACSYAHDIATCLALLHARRLLHRDISPGNVRLDGEGRAKLLDFGALGDFGAPREVVGTPAYMPLESVHCLPLDQRSDLFSLGATLYYALTGRAAFDAQRIEDVALAGRKPPLPPSVFARDVPEALDQLVLCMLHTDRQKRPSSAAEVLDRLAAIAGLDAEPLDCEAESHLLSSALVGRSHELQRLRQLIERALRGEGGSALITGGAGMGRSRLATEVSISARIAGMTSVYIDALAHAEPAGALAALARALLVMVPLEAAASWGPHADVLGRAFPELRLHAPGAVPLPKDHAERKLLVQRAFSAWVEDVAKSRPLLIVIDDAHVLDADSAGLCALLAHAAPRLRLLIVATQERDAAAPAPIQTFARVAARVALQSLTLEGVEHLIASIFGDVPYRARLAQWLFATGSGNPGHSLELLHQLVQRAVIRYVGGAWVLPTFLPEQELPRGVDDALQARLHVLGPEALRLARMFSLHRGALSLQVCLQLAPDHPAAVVVATLDRLVGAAILVRAAGTYRLARTALRASTLREVSAAELVQLHAALARALMAARPELFGSLATHETQDLCLLLEAAGHLDRAGDPRGMALMREAAIELTVRGDGLSEAVPALEARVLEQRALGRPDYELGALLVPLSLAGTYCDYRLSYRYGVETLDILLDLSGLRWAARLRHWIGGRPALYIGLLAGSVRFHVTRRARVARSFRDVMLGVMGIGTALLGTFSVLLDRAAANGVAARLEILQFFPAGHPVRWVSMLQRALFDATRGEIAQACSRALAAYGALRELRGMRDEARLQLQVGCLTPVSLAYSLRVDGKAHEVFTELDRLQTSVSRQIVAGGRAVYHGHRGESAKYLAYRDEMDLLASQAGSTWREDIGTPRQMWSTYLLTEDVLGLKRASNDLDALVEVPSIRKLRDVAHACYLCERGLASQALSHYRSLFEEAIFDPGLQGIRFAGAYARILRCAGEPERAKEVCIDALARLAAPERVFKVATFTAELELALATVALGDLTEASRLIEQLLQAQREHDNPLLHGLTHKARAQLALQQDDVAAFTTHLAEMERWFQRTNNPALIAQCQHLLERAQRAGLLAPAAPPATGTHRKPSALDSISVAFDACRGPAERLNVAIDVVLAETGAERGYLYLLESSKLRFAAPLAGPEPPASLRTCIEAQLAEVQTAASCKLPVRSVRITGPEDSTAEYSLLLLAAAREQGSVVVGAMALVVGPQRVREPKAGTLESIARAILSAPDVREVYMAPGKAFVTVRARPAR